MPPIALSPEHIALKERLQVLSRNIARREEDYTFASRLLLQMPVTIIRDLAEHAPVKLCISISSSEDPPAVVGLARAHGNRDSARQFLHTGNLEAATADIVEGEQCCLDIREALMISVEHINQVYNAAGQGDDGTWVLPALAELGAERMAMVENVLSRLPSNRNSMEMGMSTLDDIVATFVEDSEDGVDYEIWEHEGGDLLDEGHGGPVVQDIDGADEAGVVEEGEIVDGVVDLGEVDDNEVATFTDQDAADLAELVGSTVVRYNGGLIRADELIFAFRHRDDANGGIDALLPASYFASRTEPNGRPGRPLGAWGFR